jgi:hypothetical protein
MQWISRGVIFKNVGIGVYIELSVTHITIFVFNNSGRNRTYSYPGMALRSLDFS